MTIEISERMILCSFTAMIVSMIMPTISAFAIGLNTISQANIFETKELDIAMTTITSILGVLTLSTPLFIITPEEHFFHLPTMSMLVIYILFWVALLVVYCMEINHFRTQIFPIDLTTEPLTTLEKDVSMFTLAAFEICCGEEAIPDDVSCDISDPIFPCVSLDTETNFNSSLRKIGEQNSIVCNKIGFTDEKSTEYYDDVDVFDFILRRCDNNNLQDFTERLLEFYINIKYPYLVLGLISIILTILYLLFLLYKYITLTLEIDFLSLSFSRITKLFSKSNSIKNTKTQEEITIEKPYYDDFN